MKGLEWPVSTEVGALADLRVLEPAGWVVGPFACDLFADFRADVISVERPGVRGNSRTKG